MEKINNSVDIINILFDYVKKHFNDFGHQNTDKHSDTGHQNTDWWWHNRWVEVGSWSPFVEACFILYGERIYPDNPREHINHDFSGHKVEPMKKYMEEIHKRNYSVNTKYQQGYSDVNLLEAPNEYVLSLEHEEKGSTVPAQKEEIFKEIKKLGDENFHSRFKVLISRPVWFNKHTANEGYFKSVGVYRDEIQEYLNNKVTLNESENWLIILIAPSPDIKPTEIIFHCYEWNGNELSDLDKEQKYRIKIKEDNGKWVKVPSEIEQT